jgi:hypothetical protein
MKLTEEAFPSLFFMGIENISPYIKRSYFEKIENLLWYIELALSGKWIYITREIMEQSKYDMEKDHRLSYKEHYLVFFDQMNIYCYYSDEPDWHQRQSICHFKLEQNEDIPGWELVPLAYGYYKDDSFWDDSSDTWAADHMGYMPHGWFNHLVSIYENVSVFEEYKEGDFKKHSKQNAKGPSPYSNVLIIDKTYNTTIIRDTPFPVQGHYATRLCGPGRTEKRQVWIDSFKKNGYHRKAKVLRE